MPDRCFVRHCSCLARILAMCLVFAAALPAHAILIHVAMTGSDTAVGTDIAPVRTIQHCADLAQPGDICRVHGGVYRETVTVGHSGSATAPIRFEAAPGECVTVSGSDPLQAAWSPYTGSIWQAKTDLRFIQLFVAGKMLNEARWPDADADDLVHMPRARAGVGTDANGLVVADAPAGDWTGAYVYVLPGQGWQSHTRRIVQYDPVTSRAGFDRPMNLPSLIPRYGNFYYLFGSLLALDREGEWFLDSANGQLYLWPPPGVDLEQPAAVEVKQRAYAFDVKQKSHIEIAGFNLFAATIRFTDTDHCTVDAVRARYVTHLRETDGYATLGDVGILSGTNNVWKNSIIAHSASSGIYVEGADNQVLNNFIHDVVYMGTNHAGIDLSNYEATIQRTQILYNTVTRSGRGGIYLMGSSAGKVVHNRVRDVALLTEDMGGIYSWGTDAAETEVGYNEVSGVTAIYGTGVYLDEGARGFIVHHNYVHDVSFVGTQMKAPNSVLNNTVERAGVAPFMMGMTAAGTWDDIASARLHDNLHDGRTGIRFELQTRNIADYGNYAAEFAVDGNWTHVSIPFDSLTQPNWANSLPLDSRLAYAMTWSAQTPGTFEVQIDNVRLEGQNPLTLADFDNAHLTNTLGATAAGNAGAGNSLAIDTVSPGEGGAGGAVRIIGTAVVGGWGSFSMPLSPAAQGVYDLSRFTGVSFDVRGTTRFYLTAADVAPEQDRNIACPLDANQLPTTDCAIDQGEVIAPYTDGYAGALPDLGAFESGVERWTAGASFDAESTTCALVPATNEDNDAGLDAGTRMPNDVDAGPPEHTPATAAAAGSGCGCSVVSRSAGMQSALLVLVCSVVARRRRAHRKPGKQ